jgi:hypothetical protein
LCEEQWQITLLPPNPNRNFRLTLRLDTFVNDKVHYLFLKSEKAQFTLIFTFDTHPDHNIKFAQNPIENSRLLLALVQILSGSFFLGTCKSKFQANNFHTCGTHENLKLILRLVRIIRGLVVIVPLSFWQ